MSSLFSVPIFDSIFYILYFIQRNFSRNQLKIEERRKREAKEKAAAEKKREAVEKRDAKKRRHEERMRDKQNAKTSTDNSPPTQSNDQSAGQSQAKSSSGPQTVAIAPSTELVDARTWFWPCIYYLCSVSSRRH